MTFSTKFALKQAAGNLLNLNPYAFLMLLRPNWNKSTTLTVTQFVHEWAHTLENRGWNIADAGRGRPSYPADIDAVSAMHDYSERLIKNRDVAPYGTSVLGEKKYRSQAAEGFYKEYGIEFPSYEIMFTPGGQFGIASVANLVSQLNNGYIITPRPWYVNHEAVSMLYAKLHPIEFFETRKITPENLQAAIDSCPKIGAFLFCNPGNPLGNIMREADWLAIGPILEKYDVPIILDEAFTEIVFDKNYLISLLHALPHLKDRTIIMRSGTKALGLSGERLALQRVPQKYMSMVEEFQSRLIGNCPLSVQSGMAAAFQNMSVEKKSVVSDYYKANADYLLGEIGDMLVGAPPEGGFYFIANFSQMLGKKMPEPAKAAYGVQKNAIENDIDICMALMFGYGQNPQSGLGTVPASCFGIKSELGLIRLSFSSSRDNLAEIARHIKQVKSA